MTDSVKLTVKQQKELDEHERNMYVFGTKPTFKYGKIRFLTFEEYIQKSSMLGVLGLNVMHIYWEYYKIAEKEEGKKISKETLDKLEVIKKTNLLSLIHANPTAFLISYWQIFYDVLEVDEEDLAEYDEAYKEVFGHYPKYDDTKKYIPVENEDQPSFKDLVMNLIFYNDSDELFLELRKKIMDMTLVTEEQVGKNIEVQRGYERQRQYQQSKNGDGSTFVDMLSSITAMTPNDFERVKNWNLHQVYSVYHRLSAIKNYDTSVLFSTVAPDVKIENWDKHIDLFAKSTTEKKKSEIEKTTKSMFG